MGHLYYKELGNLGYYDTSGNIQSGYGLTETGDFESLIASLYYWSGTEYVGNSSCAWYFRMGYGGQNSLYKEGGLSAYGLAVRTGQVSASSTPVPGTVLLLGIGIAGLAEAGRRKGRNV